MILIDAMISLAVLTIIVGGLSASTIIFQRIIHNTRQQEVIFYSATTRISTPTSLPTGNPVILTESINGTRQLHRVVLQ